MIRKACGNTIIEQE